MKPLVSLWIILLGVTWGGSATAGDIMIWQSLQDKTVTQGQVDLEAAPEVVYAALTRYSDWAALFSDVKWARQKGGGQENALLQYKSRTYGRAYHWRFTNARNSLVRYYLTDGPSGVVVTWQVKLVPLRRGGDNSPTRTRLKARVVAKIGGIYGWLVSDAKVQRYREKKLRRDLVDLHQRFRAPASQTAAAR